MTNTALPDFSNVSERKTIPASLIGGLLCACSCLFLSPATMALELGFEGLLLMESTDNIDGADNPDEQDGDIQSGLLGLYGEHRTRIFNAAFRGELDTRKEESEDDSSFNTITRFLGAAEFKLTPRSWRWFVGDVLGGIRVDDGIQPISDSDLESRNIFVTGPSFSYDVVGFSSTQARFLYVHQVQDDLDLETLYTATLSYERDRLRGNYTGVRFGNIFTDVSDSSLAADELAEGVDPDYNRISAGLYHNRKIRTNNLLGEIGATSYKTYDGSLTGAYVFLEGTRELGPQSSVSLTLSRDLYDQSLSTIESLISSGEDTIGVSPESSGVFVETRIGAEYSINNSSNTATIGAGSAQLDYRLLSVLAEANRNPDLQDRDQWFAYVSWIRQLTNRLSADVGASFESQDYDNLSGNSQSTLLRAKLTYDLSRSFSLQLGAIRDSASGLRSRFTTELNSETTEVVGDKIDVTENRFTIGIRWMPPSRASQELTVELKSLLR